MLIINRNTQIYLRVTNAHWNLINSWKQNRNPN